MEFHHFARGAFAGFHVKRRACADASPQGAAFPAGVFVVDAAIDPFGVEAEWIWDAQDHPFAVFEHEETFGAVAGVDGNILAEAEAIKLMGIFWPRPKQSN